MMKIKYIRKHFLSLLAMFVLVAYSNAQVKTDLPTVAVAEPLSFTGRQAKLSKTQGTDAYQNIHCGLQDKAGNLWFGTTGEGVYRYDGKLFTQFTVKNGLSHNTVWSILEDALGNIWFGTDKGISCYDGNSIRSIPITLTETWNFYSNTYSDNKPASKNEVWSMMQDRSGKIWFGTSDGIYCYNGKTFSRFLDNQNIVNSSGLTLKSIACMLEDRNGNIWFGSGPMAFEGISKYDGKSLSNFRPKDEGWIRNITEDKNGDLLFSSRHNAVIKYDGINFSDFPKPQGLRGDLLNTILVDSKGNTWYASDYVNDRDLTAGGVWKSDGKSFVEFTKKDGLNNTAVYLFLEDRSGNIWIGSRDTGLYRYDGKTIIRFSE